VRLWPCGQPQTPDLGSQVGDHVGAFCSSSSSSDSLDDIVVDYLSAGLQAGHKCFGMVDTPSAVRDRIPGDLVSRDGMLHIRTEDEAYMPDGRFSKDAFISTMKTMVEGAFAEGYDRFRAVGDESFIVRNSVDINLDIFDGGTVMCVLRTHPRIYVNGIVITNPHYVPADQLPG
jgi:hypothetical protein